MRQASVHNFNPRFPRGKRPSSSLLLLALRIFQSTLPAGEATITENFVLSYPRDFNPRFPRGKRLVIYDCHPVPFDFNPRFPRGKRPGRRPPLQCNGTDFNPRFPRGKRRYHPRPSVIRSRISIHASREGSDKIGENCDTDVMPNFNPRFPRGKRHWVCFHFDSFPEFQSTLPAREATLNANRMPLRAHISIHASREGSDNIRYV